MPIAAYTPQHFEAVRAFALRVGVPILTHRPFVDYYYASRDHCRLYLFLGEDQAVIGTVGVERLGFEHEGREIQAAVGSNFHVSQPGVGGYLFFQWVRTCPFSLEFGGSEDAHKIIRQQKWTYFGGIRTYLLNSEYPVHPGNTWLHATAKWVLRRTHRKAIPRYSSRLSPEALAVMSAREEHSYTADLLPQRSPFAFRLTPSLEYLQWRYDLALSFVRYRLFRILSRDQTIGYVILSDFPDRLIVAQCDGVDPEALAWGTLLSLLQAAANDRAPRQVVLNCAHKGMQAVYERFGFRPQRQDFLFALGSRQAVEIPADTSRWLVNYDWCDNGLFASVPPREPV